MVDKGDAAGDKQPVNAVPYTLAKNYFLNNNYQAGDLESPKIVSEAAFSRYFGAARTMSPEGKPTPIDFSTHYVIAVIGPLTDYNTTMSVQSLLKEKDTLVLRYSINRGAKMKAFIQPVLLAVVSQDYTGEVVLREL